MDRRTPGPPVSEDKARSFSFRWGPRPATDYIQSGIRSAKVRQCEVVIAVGAVLSQHEYFAASRKYVKDSRHLFDRGPCMADNRRRVELGWVSDIARVPEVWSATPLCPEVVAVSHSKHRIDPGSVARVRLVMCHKDGLIDIHRPTELAQPLAPVLHLDDTPTVPFIEQSNLVPGAGARHEAEAIEDWCRRDTSMGCTRLLQKRHPVGDRPGCPAIRRPHQGVRQCRQNLRRKDDIVVTQTYELPRYCTKRLINASKKAVVYQPLDEGDRVKPGLVLRPPCPSTCSSLVSRIVVQPDELD